MHDDPLWPVPPYFLWLIAIGVGFACLVGAVHVVYGAHPRILVAPLSTVVVSLSHLTLYRRLPAPKEADDVRE